MQSHHPKNKEVQKIQYIVPRKAGTVLDDYRCAQALGFYDGFGHRLLTLQTMIGRDSFKIFSRALQPNSCAAQIGYSSIAKYRYARKSYQNGLTEYFTAAGFRSTLTSSCRPPLIFD
jgi:hypothetical protein